MAVKEKTKSVTNQEMSFRALRQILFDELNGLRAGDISVSRARVTSQLARRIIETATLDLYAQGLLGNGKPEEAKRLMGNYVQGQTL